MALKPDIAGAHESAAHLIPWLINGTLAGEEAARLRAHLATCAQCHEDFQRETELYEAIRADGPLVFSGEPSFERLMARIEADDFAAPAPGPSVAPELARSAEPAMPPAAERPVRRFPWRSAAAVRWLAAAVLIEALGLGLGAWLWPSGGTGSTAAYLSQTAPYRTLSTPAARPIDGPLVHAVFRPNLSLGELQTLLQSVGARIVDGPSEAHVYTLGFAEPIASAKVLETRIDVLRASKEVLFAEPVGGRPRLP